MTQPSEQEVTVAIDALHDEGVLWITTASRVEAMAGIARGLDLTAFHFSVMGRAAGLDSLYSELQDRIAGLLGQAAANFEDTGRTLTAAANTYRREDDQNMHEIKKTW